LADVLARLRVADPRWRLVVCGEGPLEGALRARLDALGVAEAADLRGYLPLDQGLRDAYRNAHAFLHVSLTEGLPQVLFEAFAAPRRSSRTKPDSRPGDHHPVGTARSPGGWRLSERPRADRRHKAHQLNAGTGLEPRDR